MTRIFRIILIGISIGFSTLHGQTIKDSLDMELDRLMSESTLTGMAVSIYTSDKILYNHAAGYADIPNKVPYATSHIQNIGSISKTYVAAALMKAVEAGKINLDDPISKYLNFEVINPHTTDKKITVRHLATHTSGIKDWKGYWSAYYLAEDVSDWTADELKIKKVGINRILKNKALSLEQYLKAYLVKGGEFYSRKNFSKLGPAGKYQYSNVAAGLLGYVIGAAVGEDFPTYSHRVVLDELGIQNSGWKHADVDMSQHAVLYGPGDKKLPKYALTTFPDGGMITSLDGLAIFAMEMLRGYLGKSDYLSPETFQEMMTSQWSRSEFRNTNTDDEHVGIIWDIAEDASYIGHNGSDPGTFTFLRFFPEKDIGYVFMINCGIDEESSRMTTISDMFTHIAIYGRKLNEATND